MKRIFDITCSLLGLILASPILLPVMFLVWLQDYGSPFYIAKRVGRGNQEFDMLKLRSMVVNADKSGVDSTSTSDRRITPIGHFIRRYKLDELSQLWNVLLGDMSMVGPRPNVKKETDLYTTVEKELLSVKPGITDFASIVFSDEGDILKDKDDPDIAYNQLIRPGKSRLGLFYIKNQSIGLDIRLCFITAIAIISRKTALEKVQTILLKLHAPDDLIELAARNKELTPSPPPGSEQIVTNRDESPPPNETL